MADRYAWDRLRRNSPDDPARPGYAQVNGTAGDGYAGDHRPAAGGNGYGGIGFGTNGYGGAHAYAPGVEPPAARTAPAAPRHLLSDQRGSGNRVPHPAPPSPGVRARSAPAEDGAAPARRRGRRLDSSPWHWLLFIPIVIPLFPPLYNRVEPTLGGVPFFYWGQLSFAVLSSVVVTIVHLATKAR